MFRLFAFFLFFIFIAHPSLADDWEYNGEIKFSVDRLPQFHEFSDGIRPPKKQAEDINFGSYEGSWSFRTRLRDGLKMGPNFAGKYRIVTHGCGTSCQVNWLVNTETGNVLDRITSSSGVSYKVDSRLLIMHRPNEEVLDYDYTNFGWYGGVTFYEFIIEPFKDLYSDNVYEQELYKLFTLKPPLIEWDYRDNPRYKRNTLD